MINLKKHLFLLIFIGTAGKAFSYEVDNFTNRAGFENLQDGLTLINAETNKRFTNAIAKLNSNDSYKCSLDLKEVYPDIFYSVKNALDTDPVGKMEEWAEENKEFPTLKPADKDIYSGSSFFSGIVRSIVGLEVSTKVSNVVMGVDKFGHFMGQGYDYYQEIRRGKTAQEMFQYGRSLEEGMYGLSTTGVKSYGDLGANFSGYQFWKNLTEGDNPYLSCDPKTDKIVINRTIDWADYINPSWDEAINCSEFTKSLDKVVNKNLKKLKISCPIQIDKCIQIANMNCADYFVSKKCLDLVPDRKIACSIGQEKKPKVVINNEVIKNGDCNSTGSLQILDTDNEKMLLNIEGKL